MFAVVWTRYETDPFFYLNDYVWLHKVLDRVPFVHLGLEYREWRFILFHNNCYASGFTDHSRALNSGRIRSLQPPFDNAFSAIDGAILAGKGCIGRRVRWLMEVDILHFLPFLLLALPGTIWNT